MLRTRSPFLPSPPSPRTLCLLLAAFPSFACSRHHPPSLPARCFLLCSHEAENRKPDKKKKKKPEKPAPNAGHHNHGVPALSLRHTARFEKRPVPAPLEFFKCENDPHRSSFNYITCDSPRSVVKRTAWHYPHTCNTAPPSICTTGIDRGIHVMAIDTTLPAAASPHLSLFGEYVPRGLCFLVMRETARE